MMRIFRKAIPFLCAVAFCFSACSTATRAPSLQKLTDSSLPSSSSQKTETENRIVIPPQPKQTEGLYPRGWVRNNDDLYHKEVAHGEDYVIDWKDDALEFVVRLWLDRPEGDILHSDVWDVNFVNLALATGYYNFSEQTETGYYSVVGEPLVSFPPSQTVTLTTLADFVHFDSLQFLCVNGYYGKYAAITDLSGLEALENLEILRLFNCIQTSDLAPLSSCTQLRILSLTNGNFDSLEPLASLQQLEKLELDYTFVSSLAPLAQLKNVKSLSLGKNAFQTGLPEDISYEPISEMTGLRYIDLTNHIGLKNLDFCKPLPHLESLELNGVKLPFSDKALREQLPQLIDVYRLF